MLAHINVLGGKWKGTSRGRNNTQAPSGFHARFSGCKLLVHSYIHERSVPRCHGINGWVVLRRDQQGLLVIARQRHGRPHKILSIEQTRGCPRQTAIFCTRCERIQSGGRTATCLNPSTRSHMVTHGWLEVLRRAGAFASVDTNVPEARQFHSCLEAMVRSQLHQPGKLNKMQREIVGCTISSRCFNHANLL